MHKPKQHMRNSRFVLAWKSSVNLIDLGQHTGLLQAKGCMYLKYPAHPRHRELNNPISKITYEKYFPVSCKKTYKDSQNHEFQSPYYF